MVQAQPPGAAGPAAARDAPPISARRQPGPSARPPPRRDYIKQQSLYRQRVWSCKYSGSNGLTYEEAVASEDKVAAVVDQVGAGGGAVPFHAQGRSCSMHKEQRRCR